MEMMSRSGTKIMPGMGKAEHADQWMRALGKDERGILFRIPREDIENCHVFPLIKNFGPQLSPEKLRGLSGRVHFAVNGYGDHPDEIYEIQEIRDYFLHAHWVYPQWLYTASVHSPCLRALFFCVASQIDVLKGDDALVVQLPDKQAENFYTTSLGTATMLNHLAGIGHDSAMSRFMSVAGYLGIISDEYSQQFNTNTNPTHYKYG